jgi:hypothetical protein
MPFGERTMDRLAHGFKERDMIRKACRVMRALLEREECDRNFDL